jgi:hypothetical protein
MAEPLTNVILASILHLIRQDLSGDGRVAPRRAPLRWAPPHQAPARRRHRRPRWSGLRATTPSPHYRPMKPSPPRSLETSLPEPPFDAPYTPRTQVNLRRLAGPPEGITPFTVVGLVTTPATGEQERGSPAMKPLTRGQLN